MEMLMLMFLAGWVAADLITGTARIVKNKMSEN